MPRCSPVEMPQDLLPRAFQADCDKNGHSPIDLRTPPYLIMNEGAGPLE